MDPLERPTDDNIAGAIELARQQPITVEQGTNPDRLTVIYRACYQIPGQDPISVRRSYGVIIKSGELPVQRSGTKVIATQSLSSLEFYWLEDNVSLIVLENLSKTNYMEVYLGSKESIPLLILPKGIQPLHVKNPEEVLVRCPEGTAPYRLTAFPRESENAPS